ncbi:hypothetical protein NGI46_10435 [Peribacillus butanolivorans]|nr:hypothetical protein [Peribacillus butanolivorans]
MGFIRLIGQLRSNNEDKGDGDSSSVSRTNDDRHRIIFSLVNRQMAVPKSDKKTHVMERILFFLIYEMMEGRFICNDGRIISLKVELFLATDE